MKIPDSSSIRAIDAYTIEHEPISSVGLMQRAASAVADWLLLHLDRGVSLKVFAGSGNNGGDALYVAFLMGKAGFDVTCYLFNYKLKLSADCAFHRELLAENRCVKLIEITGSEDLPEIQQADWVVDGLFGTGLNRSLDEPFISLIHRINASCATVVAIDIPSGMFCEDNRNNSFEDCIHATYTLAFQFPKLSFLFAENSRIVGHWEVLPIGLHPDAIAISTSVYSLVEKRDLAQVLKRREKFAHKGNFGRALLVGGSRGKIGAMVLASRAALRSGVGLLTVHVPACGNDIVQAAVPEAMTQPDATFDKISDVTVSERICVIGVGCGMGTSHESIGAFQRLLCQTTLPLVIDADGLNVLSQHLEWLPLLSHRAVLTPHPLEFDRLVGSSSSCYERLEKARVFASRYKVVVVLKGAYTAVVNECGEVSFNTTGNPGMATPGSGDALTGIVVALLAQGYDAFVAAKLAVYLHGLAGDIALKRLSVESLIASDLVEHMGDAFRELKL